MFIHKVLLYFKGEPGQVAQVSKEVAILPYDSKSGQFSHPGDSGPDPV
jgi:hypothetical protein